MISRLAFHFIVGMFGIYSIHFIAFEQHTSYEVVMASGISLLVYFRVIDLVSESWE